MLEIIRIRTAFKAQKASARARGIPWELTFEQWLVIWEDSGRWDERGRRKNQYCMARFNDEGPYAVWNVKIIKHSENSSEGQLGHKMSESNRLKLIEANTGNKHTLGRKLELSEDIRESKRLTMLLNTSKRFPNSKSVLKYGSEWMMY